MRGKSTIGGSYHRKDSSGIGSGLTVCREFQSDQTMNDSDFNQSGSAAPGFTRQAKGQRTSSSVSEKGKSMSIC